MRTVPFSEYMDAKNAIIGGVDFYEHSEVEGGRIIKRYATENNEVFYEVTENGITEFWSDKYSLSRRYDGRTREEIIDQYEAIIARLEKENLQLKAARSACRFEVNKKMAAIKAMAEAVEKDFFPDAIPPEPGAKNQRGGAA